MFASFMVAPGRSLFRQFVLTFATAVVRWPMSRRIRQLVVRASPKLHLGCASTILPGWINVDLFGRLPADVALDLRRPLPIADSSVDAIFTEHMLEHLTYGDAVVLVRECARVLRPGGLMRIVVPDFEKQARSYAGAPGPLATDGAGHVPPLVALANIAYGHAHRSIWDSATLILLLEQAGLAAQKQGFGESRLHPCPDSTARAAQSLYVEAVKSA
jgi:predicted SAM-dependent methyltransferase